jgi:Methyltransferase FkbM domain
MPSVAELARFIWVHPANRGRRLRAVAGAFAWQVYKRTTGKHWDLRVWNGARFRVYPDSASASLVLYCGGLPDYHEMRFMAGYLRPGDAFIDVGANIGVYSLFAESLVGRAGRIVAFEPGLRAAARLRENVILNGLRNIEVREEAVGAKARTVTLTLDRDTMNRVVPPADASAGRSGGGAIGPGVCSGDVRDREADPLPSPVGGQPSGRRGVPRLSHRHIAPHSGAPTGAVVEVACVRLDEVLAGRTFAMGKMDIEGAEPLALCGAERMLTETNPPVWLVEMNGLLRDFGWTEESLAAWLAEKGFELAVYDADDRRLRFPDSPWLERANVLAIAGAARKTVEARLSKHR